jgi:hypothetical protein
MIGNQVIPDSNDDDAPLSRYIWSSQDLKALFQVFDGWRTGFFLTVIPKPSQKAGRGMNISSLRYQCRIEDFTILPPIIIMNRVRVPQSV